MTSKCKTRDSNGDELYTAAADEARGLTFEEDKLALAVLVDGIYLGRQAPPEHADEHGVSRHDRVISHPPKPVVLKESKARHIRCQLRKTLTQLKL